MKKLLLTALGCMVSLMGFGQASTLYICGTSPLQWGSPTPMSLTYDSQTKEYTKVTFAKGSQPEFKISTATGSWDTFNGGIMSPAKGVNLTTDQINTKLPLTGKDSGNNIKAPTSGNYILTISYDNGYYMTLATEDGQGVVKTYPSKLYIKGADNDWKGNEQSVISLEGSNADGQTQYVYKGTLASLSGQFKICETSGDTWSGIQIGGNDYPTTSVSLGTSINVTDNGNNFECSGPFTNVTITLTYKPSGTSTLLLESEDGVTYPEAIYVLGDAGTNSGWAPNEGVASTTGDTKEGIYTFTDLVIRGNFSFTTELGTSSDWSSLSAANRWAAEEANKDVSAGGNFVLSQENVNDYSFKANGGKYNLTVNLQNKTLDVEPVKDTPTSFSFIGQFTDNGTASEDWITGKEMSGSNGTYTIENVQMMGINGATDAYFRFKSGLGIQYGPEQNGTAASLQGANALITTSENAYYVPNGTYTFTLTYTDDAVSFTVTGTPDKEDPEPGPSVPSEVCMVYGTDPSSLTTTVEFVNEGDQIFTKEDLTLAGTGFYYFRFADSNEAEATQYGPTTDQLLVDGTTEESPLAANTNVFKIKGGTYTFTVLAETLEEMNVTIEGEANQETVDPDPTAPTLYIVGNGINGTDNWNTPTTAFTYSDGTYTVTLQSLSLTGFKIVDENMFDGDYNIGLPGGEEEMPLTVGQPSKVINNKDSKNIRIDANCEYLANVTITLTQDNEVDWQITVNGTPTGEKVTKPDALYIVGTNINGSSVWEPGDNNKMTDNNDGTYSITLSTLGTGLGKPAQDAGFKIYNGTWSSDFNFGGGADKLVLGTPYQVEYNGQNIQIESEAETISNVTVTFNLNDKTVTVTGEDAGALKLYVIGANVNGIDWTGDFTQNEMTSANGVYTLSNVTMSTGGFKIFSGSWSDADHNFGSNGEKLQLGQEYQVGQGDSSTNIEIDCGYTQVSNATITFNMGTGILTVTGTPSGESLEEMDIVLYVRGFDVNGVQNFEYGADNMMTKQDDGTYTVTLGYLENTGFQIATETYEYINYGTNGDDLVLNETYYPQIGGEGKDIIIAGGYEMLWNVTMIFDPKAETLYVTGETQDPNGGGDGVHTIYDDLNGDEVIFTIQGVRIDASKITRGIYIINGKKVMVK